MTFRVHANGGAAPRTFDFTYAYDATDLVRAEAARLLEPGETLGQVYRVLTPEEEKRRADNGLPTTTRQMRGAAR